MDNVVDFKPITESLKAPFAPANLTTVFLIVGIVTAAALLWMQILKPVGAVVQDVVENVTESAT